LEKELSGVKKAREALGDKAPTFGRSWPRDRGQGSGVLGKRRRDGESSGDEDIPEDIKSIPMPRDTPPPIAKEVLDKWYAKRRARWQAAHGKDTNESDAKEAAKEAAPKPPPVESKSVYEAKPLVRDLQKEAVSTFVPTSVRLKMDKGKGQGGLMEPEEADQLEREGYLKLGQQNNHEADSSGPGRVTMEEVEDEEG
jgi:hypothetical protein